MVPPIRHPLGDKLWILSFGWPKFRSDFNS
jgi:hypothetical protein